MIKDPTHYRLTTLGPVGLQRADGTSVSTLLGRSKRLALLIYLAAGPNGRRRRDKILGVFWPDFDEARARSALSKAIHYLRSELGEHVVTSNHQEEVGVDLACLTCDLQDFRHALSDSDSEAVLERYTGDFLDGFFAREAPGFERWAEQTRQELKDDAVHHAERLTRAAVTAGDHPSVAAWARRWAQLAPGDEAAARAMMEAWHHLGQRAKALEAFDVLSTYLAGLELEASQATRTLATRIRNESGPPGAIVPTVPDTPGFSTDIVRSSRGNASAGQTRTAARGENNGRPEPANAITIRRPIAVVLVIAGLAALALAFTQSITAPLAGDRPTVRVNAFANLTDDESLGTVGSIYRRAIEDGLATLFGLEVLADTTRPSTLTVGGSFHRLGDSLELAVDIIDRTEGRVLPAPAAVRVSSADPATAADEVRRRVRAAVAYHTTTWHPVDLGRRPPDWDAYVTFQEAFYTMLGWGTGEGSAVARADTLLRHVLELDPGYSEAYLLLGGFVFMQQRPAVRRAVFYQRGRPDAMDSLVTAMRRSPRPPNPLDRLIANMHDAFARADYGSFLRWSQALGEVLPSRPHVSVLFSAAIANRPGAALSHYATSSYGEWLFDMWLAWFWLTANYHLAGDYHGELSAVDSGSARPYLGYGFRLEALRAHAALGDIEGVRELTARLNPQLAYTGALELRAHGLERADDRLLAESDRLLHWFADWFDGRRHALVPKLMAAWVLPLQGRVDEVVTYLEPMVRDSGHLVDVKGLLGAAYARQGDRGAAEAIDRELAAEDPDGLRGLHTLWRARIAAQLGQKAKAVTLLDQALREGTWFQPLAPIDGAFWHTDPHFEPLRDYPPYERLVAPQ